MRRFVTIVVLVVLAVAVYNYLAEDDGLRDAEPPFEPQEQDSDLAVIRAVNDHLTGKTFITMESEQAESVVSCTQQDADLDALGMTCSGAGGLYGYGVKVVSYFQDVPVEADCPVPPPVDSPSWDVRNTGPGTWWVSNPQGSWDVAGQDGGYLVEANQDC